MRKLVVILLLIAYPAGSAWAAPRLYFEAESPGGALFMKVSNGEVQVSRGLISGYDLTDLVKDNPEALRQAELHMKHSRNAFIALTAQFTLMLTGLIWGLAATDSSGHVSTPVPLLLIVGSLVPAFIGIHHTSEAQFHLIRAINIYNGVPYSPEQKAQMASRSVSVELGSSSSGASPAPAPEARLAIHF